MTKEYSKVKTNDHGLAIRTWNPFLYIHNDDDIQNLVHNLLKSSALKDFKGSQDPFWDAAAQNVLMALTCFVHYECDAEDQSLSTVIHLLRRRTASNKSEADRPLASIFRDLEDREKEIRDSKSIAVKYYKHYRCYGDLTLQTIQAILIEKLENCNLEELRKTMNIEMELQC